ncbi:MAG TPA: hypothetical protein VLG09_02335 [Candidatus Saccharimonadales bacterium]|nr:hypothetical protein [Candidatus Saccharimonadales bacterium]
MNKRELTAATFRLILSASLVVITGIGITLFSLANDQLRSVATDVSHVVVDANASQDNLTTLEKIKKTLASEQDIVARTNQIVAESKSYEYQDQIVTDLNGYASKAGIAITNLDFSAGAAKTPGATAAPVVTSGLHSTSVTVTIQNPVGYNQLLQFMKSLEQNLTKMQISKVSLSRGEGGGVTSDAFAIEVYIK